MTAPLDITRERMAERRADQLISKLEINDADDLDIEAIAMTQNALVIEGGLKGAEARLARSRKLNFIRVNTRIPEPGRRRFAIAHELGHLLLQQNSQFALCTDKNLMPFYTNSPDELEASVFGATLLMPAKFFEPLCHPARPSLGHISDLAEQFQVTLTAAATRFMRFCPHRCCLVVSTDGRVRYHRKTDDFGYFIAPREDLSPDTYAADIFKGEQIPTGMREVKATAWLAGKRIDSSKTILEESTPMPSYGSALTLLWIDKDIDQYITGEDEYQSEQDDSDSRWSWNRYRDRE
jgi:Zn-dependent peptidase ImmA (M78 family)